MTTPPTPSNPATTPISPTHPLTGRCFCGSITYTLSAPPLTSYLCHCLDCRRFSGTSFAYNANFDAAALRISTPAGDLLREVLSTYGDKASGTRQFCRKCGTPLFMATGANENENGEDTAGTAMVIVAMGTVDGSERDERLKPSAEGWCKRREIWLSKAWGTTESEEW